MRIRRIDLYLNHQPFRFGFVSMHIDRRQASGVLVRMQTDSGVVGWGESTPREYVSGETCESVLALIRTRFAQPLFAADLGSTRQIMDFLDLLAAQTRVTSPVPATSALGAVDLALWDAWGQVCHTPALAFFAPDPLPRPALSLSVPILPLEQIRQLHPLTAGLGVSHFKLVLSADVEENVARLALLRDLVGSRAILTADANGKLTPNQVRRMLPAMGPFGLAAIEQPASRADLDGLKRLRREIDLPITVDESVCTLAHARHVIKLEACDNINLKLSKCGGLYATRKIHRLARQHGIACQLGSHVGETAILAAAGEIAAQAFPDLRFMEIGSTVLYPSPQLRPPGGPKSAIHTGLGLSIDTDSIDAHLGPPVLTLRSSSK
jgi:muconate cycloisomerase